MKRILLILALLTVSIAASAQLDSLTRVSMDTTLVGRDIMSLVGGKVSVSQSSAVRSALNNYIRSNSGKKIQGYRIRVFYENGPQARTRSESIAAYLRSQYPENGVYRSFEAPNYKVTVGDFRSKEEALRIYMSLKGTYPTAYIIKETINYPL
ncbi:MAG: SPOR domain-containing protein [Bacteroidales bacterium]|nr:SPOR domain-containing protein [Bacteroidales bacterium]MBP5675983.1 SPOR domain-containing protein [Bacteroidales bacterium]